MKKFILLLLGIVTANLSLAQTNKTSFTTNQLRINFINPAIEVEKITGNNSAISVGLGIGYGGGYPDLTTSSSGFISIISPFLDLQYKHYTNFRKRQSRRKSIDSNSANFISLRFLSRGKSISENVIRTSDSDFAIGPTWGIQRTIKERIHFLFDIGPFYYFDTKGNGNIFPFLIQLNLGYNLKTGN